MSYDLIVIGTGAVGSSALFHASKQGLRVLGLDRFPPGHDRGSSHGETRMIRLSYFEHPDYVPLLRRAYQLWDELVEQTGQDLFHRCGVFYSGPPECELVKGVLASSAEHKIDLEKLTPEESNSKFPSFSVGENDAVLYEPNAGYLQVEKCIIAYLKEAVQLGAEHRYGESVQKWEKDGEGFVVATDQEQYRTARLIISAGCWANHFLSDLGIPLRVVRKHLHWYGAPADLYGESRGHPCFVFESDGCFYGFPANSPEGLKVGEHSGGTEIDDPLNGSREPDPADTERVESFLKKHLPGVPPRRTRHDVCFYTRSPDEHFIVDRHPEHENVVFAAGLSGHGFKCSSALGETLVRMVSDREPKARIGFLGMKRFEK